MPLRGSTPELYSSDRQLAPPNAPIAYGDDHPHLQLGRARGDHMRNDPSHVLAVQALLSDSNRRGFSGSRSRKERVEIGVQRNHDPIFPSSSLEDDFVIGAREANVRGVNRVVARGTKMIDGRARNLLVEQEGDHAAGRSVTRSSRAAAAYSSACRMSASSSSGYSWRSSSRSGYAASASSTRRTVMRSPRMQGCPLSFFGSTVIRSKRDIPEEYSIARFRAHLTLVALAMNAHVDWRWQMARRVLSAR